MRTLYNDMDIHFSLEGVSFHALNIVFEHFERTIPSHIHGNGCYEIHYISTGHGKLKANDTYFELTPNTLFVTGPHVEHAQTPVPDDPMEEYCVYFKLDSSSHMKKNASVLPSFIRTSFWLGQDRQGIHALMLRLFDELAKRYTGFQEQVPLLLTQLVILMVRNYEQLQISRSVFTPNNLADSKSVIIEEYFLYEYQDLSLPDLSDRLKLSPRQTQRLLMEYYGKTFQQKKAEARMSAAAILLSDPQKRLQRLRKHLDILLRNIFLRLFAVITMSVPGNTGKSSFLKPFSHSFPARSAPPA